jgi:hypothetical protein
MDVTLQRTATPEAGLDLVANPPSHASRFRPVLQGPLQVRPDLTAPPYVFVDVAKADIWEDAGVSAVATSLIAMNLERVGGGSSRGAAPPRGSAGPSVLVRAFGSGHADVVVSFSPILPNFAPTERGSRRASIVDGHDDEADRMRGYQLGGGSRRAILPFPYYQASIVAERLDLLMPPLPLPQTDAIGEPGHRATPSHMSSPLSRSASVRSRFKHSSKERARLAQHLRAWRQKETAERLADPYMDGVRLVSLPYQADFVVAVGRTKICGISLPWIAALRNLTRERVDRSLQAVLSKAESELVTLLDDPLAQIRHISTISDPIIGHALTAVLGALDASTQRPVAAEPHRASVIDLDKALGEHRLQVDKCWSEVCKLVEGARGSAKDALRSPAAARAKSAAAAAGEADAAKAAVPVPANLELRPLPTVLAGLLNGQQPPKVETARSCTSAR